MTLPGVYQEIEYLSDPGAILYSQRILFIGMRLASAGDGRDLIPQRILGRSDSQLFHGAGSQLDLMLRAALATGERARQDRQRGGTPELWSMAIPPLDGADVSTQTMTFAGTAGVAGRITLYANDIAISVTVQRDWTATQVAAALQVEIERHSANLGFTTGAAAGVITWTARTAGLWGEELYLEMDFERVSGLSVTIARGDNGTTTPDISGALAASLAVDYDCIVVPTGDATARAAVAAHIEAAWTPGQKRYRIVVVPFSGTLSAASSATADLNDRRVVLTCAEKNVGTGRPWDSATSSRSHDFEVAASVGTRFYTQRQANYNYNGAGLPVSGRPATVTTAALEAARDAGVCIVLRQADQRDPGYLLDPVTTYFQDPDLLIPDTTWGPVEIPRVVQTLSRSFDVALAAFTTVLDTPEEVKSARASVFAVLRTAADDRLIREPDRDKVLGETGQEGNTIILRLRANYQIIRGVDAIEFTHRIER